MIVSLEFNRRVQNRAAVERAVRVTAKPAVEIRPHWFGDDRLDFRPEEYWKPGTEVTVDLRLRDVEGAPGVYGIQQKTFTFTVGRSQVSAGRRRRAHHGGTARRRAARHRADHGRERPRPPRTTGRWWSPEMLRA